MNPYPIIHLYGDVKRIFASLKGIDFNDAFEKGFDNRIREMDTEGKINLTSSIYNNTVRLSMAFCQYLWIFCKIGLMFADYNRINECASKMSEIDRKKFFKEIDFATKSRNSNIEGIEEALYIDSVYPREKVLQTSNMLFSYADEIKNNGASDESKKALKRFIFDPIFSIGANGAYIYALAFILLHEYSHFELGHCQFEGPKEEEIAADFSAFWNIVSDSNNDREIHTATIGMVCSLCSIAILQETWKETEEHPAITDRIERLLKVVDKPQIKANVKLIICYYVRIWALISGKKDCPDIINGNIDESFDAMLAYVKQY